MSEETVAGKKINRRAFLNRGAVIAASATALGSTALSYSRTVGANDRISLGHIGIGNRGTELDWIAGRLKDKHNVEMTAVCDLWTVNREKAAARNEKYYGRAPRQFKYLEDLLALKDVDAVEVKFTVYPEAWHDSWTEAYDNPELYKWLLEHKRKAK